MPLYEYWCRRCGEKYELLRPIGRGDEPATCPKGHAGGARTLSTFSARVATADAPRPSAETGGCGCGGACACGGH
jgi:putative FmdB family regulatory protein